MSRYQAHLKQANANLTFLGIVNSADPERYDWQTTVAFYSALHLVIAWLCDYGLRYRSHHDVKHAINPFQGRESALSEQAYIDYQTLFRLSRRARYLLDESSADENLVAHTSEKHFAKAMRRLDALVSYFQKELEGFTASTVSLKSDKLTAGEPLQVFEIK